MKAISRFALALAVCGLLTGCNLRPLYSNGSAGVVGQQLGSIDVAPIEGKAGWLVRNALRDSLGAFEQNSPAYRLEVILDDRIEGFGVRSDDTITRERRTLRARYQLVRLADGVAVLDATAGSDAGIDVVSSEYATISAENTALDNLSQTIAAQIVARISRLASETQSPSAP